MKWTETESFQYDSRGRRDMEQSRQSVKKKPQIKNSQFSSKCLEKHSLQQNTFNVYYCTLSVEEIFAANSDTGTCDKCTSIIW